MELTEWRLQFILHFSSSPPDERNRSSCHLAFFNKQTKYLSLSPSLPLCYADDPSKSSVAVSPAALCERCRKLFAMLGFCPKNFCVKSSESVCKPTMEGGGGETSTKRMLDILNRLLSIVGAKKTKKRYNSYCYSNNSSSSNNNNSLKVLCDTFASDSVASFCYLKSCPPKKKNNNNNFVTCRPRRLAVKNISSTQSKLTWTGLWKREEEASFAAAAQSRFPQKPFPLPFSGKIQRQPDIVAKRFTT